MNAVYAEKGKKVVTLTGGSGGAIILEGLRGRDVFPVAICTTFDDGGSTGRILHEFGDVLPAGDLRRCLWALSEPGFARDVFGYRLEASGTGVASLGDHSIGNILLLAAERMLKDPLAGIRAIGQLLHICGDVLPVSVDTAQLVALLADSTKIIGEAAIGERTNNTSAIVQMYLEPQAAVLRDAAAAIREADLIVAGPGDLYTSIIPCLLPVGVREALAASKAKLVFVMNLSTRAAETKGFTARKFVEEFLNYAGKGRVDVVLYNTHPVPVALQKKYEEDGAEIVTVLPEDLEDLVSRCVGEDLLSRRGMAAGLLRHSPTRLSNQVCHLLAQVSSL